MPTTRSGPSAACSAEGRRRLKEPPRASDAASVSVDSSGLSATLARIRQITGGLGVVPPASGSGTTATASADFSAALASARSSGGASAVAKTAAAPAPAADAGSVTGAELDAWMASKNPGAPLVGMGDVLVREGRANGIDPRALAAIARAESSLGSDPGARARNNAFGWGPHKSFASWEENIATVARGLRSGYLDDGLLTLAQIQGRYAPVGVSNDPTNLNSNWLRNTRLLYEELGGDPDGSVAMTV